jgi:hypothetical protein
MSQPNPNTIRPVRKPGRRGPLHFKQRAIERLYRAGQRVGMVNPIVEVHPDGKLSLVPGELAHRKGVSELEQWQAKHAHHAQGN